MKGGVMAAAIRCRHCKLPTWDLSYYAPVRIGWCWQDPLSVMAGCDSQRGCQYVALSQGSALGFAGG